MDTRLPSVPGHELLSLDIGCGVGWHSIQFATQFPHKQLVAIEHGKIRYEKLVRRLEKHPQIQNVTPVHQSVEAWCLENLRSRCVERVFFLYPNPYPKLKQAKRRLYNKPFLRHLIDCLVPGGTVLFATNEWFYIEECKQRLSELGLSLENERTLAHVDESRTHFEKKYLATGQPCYEISFQYKAGPCMRHYR